MLRPLSSGRLSAAVATGAVAALVAAVGAIAADEVGHGKFKFTPIPNEGVCQTDTHGADPITLPPGFTQTVIASQPQYADLPDMNTLNETGPQEGRYLYQVHEVGSGGSLSRIDLKTGTVTTVASRADWERLDGIVWTKEKTVLFAEEINAQGAGLQDPAYPTAQAGLVYEYDPDTNTTVARPALGAKAHEGMRFDPEGNLYSISESNPGYVFKFTPDKKGDFSSGQLYALKVTAPGIDTGEAMWVPLARVGVQVNANAEAGAAGATAYNRPEDVEIGTSTGKSKAGDHTVYVAVTNPPDGNRVIAIDLREPDSGKGHSTAFVYEYVRQGLNTDAQFEWPDNLALDHEGNLFITEDKPNPTMDGRPDDIWAAIPPNGDGNKHLPASLVARFASLKECTPEPTGIYFDKDGGTLFVNIQHRGGDGLDRTVAVAPTK